MASDSCMNGKCLSASGTELESGAGAMLAPAAKSLLPQQPDRFPHQRCNRKTQAAEERNRRAMETFQATINGRREEHQPQQKEADDQNGPPLSLLLPHAGIDQPHQPQPLEDAGGRNQRAGYEHRSVAPARGNKQYEGGDEAQNQSVANSPLEQGLQ